MSSRGDLGGLFQKADTSCCSLDHPPRVVGMRGRVGHMIFDAMPDLNPKLKASSRAARPPTPRSINSQHHPTPTPTPHSVEHRERRYKVFDFIFLSHCPPLLVCQHFFTSALLSRSTFPKRPSRRVGAVKHQFVANESICCRRPD